MPDANPACGSSAMTCSLRQDCFSPRVDMAHCCVEKRQSGWLGTPEKEGQFCSGEDQRFNLFPGLHLFDDVENRSACLRQKLVLEQLVDVFFMNKRLFGFAWHNQLEAGTSKHAWIKVGTHGEAGAEQAEASKSKDARSIARRLNDADQRNRGT